MIRASEISIVQSSRAAWIAGLVGLLLLLALLAAPYWAGRADMRLLSEIYLYLALACLWNILAGYAGLVSVGQHAYVGLGGYMLFALAMFGGINPLVAIPLAGLIGGVASMLVAVLIFRLSGAYFAIGTWVVAETFRLSFAQVSALGGGSGTSLPAGIVTAIGDGRDGREAIIYWGSLGIAVLVLAAIFLLLRSRQGPALKAIRDNELAARSLGIDIWRSKFIIYVGASTLTAMVGAAIFLQKLRISPDAAFSVNDWTAFVIFIVVIGGIGTLEGPIIGTIVFFLLRETLADLGPSYQLILGLVAIVVMLRAPQGLWGFVRSHYRIELFPLTPRAIDSQSKKDI
ncbi:branched-chain amino acid ABC transporter permease [Devosia sp.]|uniref:branched-chain amino acid ABC transporter permease n=1 Tax=Devosia sp. TaxID=1871048 RepID=UPI0027352375|nr:branched-chain amino acid ABC transporter permease [Devosia sp.]MDP2780601.1 branched-chain amino acid ABC transporter permease [Devosia sp.]